MKVMTAPRTPAKPGSAATFLYRTSSFVARPDSLDKLQAAIETFEAYVRCRERGTRFFGSMQDADDPSRFLLVSVFEDERAELVHRDSEAYCALQAAIAAAAVAGVREQKWMPGFGL